ncbi:MAG: PLP-dependent aminotransferase family protein [Clostridia bacterium]|nr:PLP-dependent aminotransferase family protein [Clostridia bacterium]
MKYKIDKQSHPIYLQIYQQLKTDIVNGNYPYNTKLPSKRLLAEETETSIVTVEHAYSLLCEEGYIEARERSGFFVVFRTSDGFVLPSLAMTHRAEPPQARSTGPDFPFSVLAKTMRGVISDYGGEILKRPPNKGCVELRHALRQYLAKNRGIVVDIEQIVIGSGAEYLYGLIIELLGRNRVYGIESPSYEQIKQVYHTHEVAYEDLPLSADGIESAALCRTAADILHTTPYRSFPSGVTASAGKRHEYISWAGTGDRFIIEDDFESEFSVSSKPEDTLFALSDADNIIYLNTFSKTISPSLRVGYMVLPQKLLQRFEEKLGLYSCTVPTFEQLVLTQLLENGDFERHINRVRRHKRKAALHG